MGEHFFGFILEVIGAFIVWACKGFKGKFDDEMTGPNEWNRKRWRNALISAGFIAIVLVVIYNNIDKKEEDKSHNKIEYTIKKQQ